MAANIPLHTHTIPARHDRSLRDPRSSFFPTKVSNAFAQSMTSQSRHSEQKRLEKCKYLFLALCGVACCGAMEVGRVDPEYLILVAGTQEGCSKAKG
jgi:hypothetical protein